MLSDWVHTTDEVHREVRGLEKIITVLTVKLKKTFGVLSVNLTSSNLFFSPEGVALMRSLLQENRCLVLAYLPGCCHGRERRPAEVMERSLPECPSWRPRTPRLQKKLWGCPGEGGWLVGLTVTFCRHS